MVAQPPMMLFVRPAPTVEVEVPLMLGMMIRALLPMRLAVAEVKFTAPPPVARVSVPIVRSAEPTWVAAFTFTAGVMEFMPSARVRPLPVVPMVSVEATFVRPVKFSVPPRMAMVAALLMRSVESSWPALLSSVSVA